MKVRPILFTSCAALLVGTGNSLAGPCNTTADKDAGSGPTPGNTARATTGAAGADSRSGEHPPTATMNQAAGSTAASNQDAQRQIQGQPTAAQEAQRAKQSQATIAEILAEKGSQRRPRAFQRGRVAPGEVRHHFNPPLIGAPVSRQ